MSGGLRSAAVGRECPARGGRQTVTASDSGDVARLTHLDARVECHANAPSATLLSMTSTTVHRVREAGGSRQRLKRIGVECLRRSRQSLAQRQANARQRSLSATTPDAMLLDAVKQACGCRRDSALAALLGIAHKTSSSVRASRSTLGPRSRRRILNDCAPFETERFDAALDSPAALAQAVRDSEAA